MRRAILLAGIIFLAVPAPAQSPENPIRLMSKAEFSSFLRTLDSDVSRWRGTVSKVDVSSLSVSYKEGKQIEQSRSFCLKALDFVRDDISGLSKKATLSSQISLLAHLDMLDSNISGFSNSLSYLVTVDETVRDIVTAERAKRDISKAQQWAMELVGVNREIIEDVNKFSAHLLALAFVIESKIDTDKLSR